MQSWATYARVERRLHLQLGFPVVGKRKTLWGYRGQRVGEADHPGPPKEKSGCRVDRWKHAIGSSKQKIASARWLSAMDGGQKDGAARVQARVDRNRKQPTMEAQKRVDGLVGAAAGLKQKAITGTRAAMWKQLIPDVRQSSSNGGATIMERIGVLKNGTGRRKEW